MVLAAIIPTVEGALWHGSRSSLPPAPQASGSATAAGRQSLRLAGKSGAASTLAAVPPPPPPPPPAPGLASVPSQQHPAPEALAMPASTNKRAKCAEREKLCKRKRDPEVGGPASAHGEPRGKDKKEHDKYCHFCQHVKVNMMACESGDCTHRFCTYCLAVHLGIDTDSAAGKGVPWHCPTCSAGCCCSQPECNKAHRHCKAFRYRCRRAAAASLRMSAAHALVSLGVSPAKGKSKFAQLAAQGTQLSPASAQHREAMTTAGSLERPAKRREQSLTERHASEVRVAGKLPRISATEEDPERETNSAISTEQMESEDGETAAGVLASFSMGNFGGRSPSPVTEQKGGAAAGAETCPGADGENGPPLSTGRLEQLAMFALQSLAAMEPARDRTPSQLDDAPAREVSEESSASTLATPRTVVNISSDGTSRSKMAIEQLTATTPSSVPSSPTPLEVNM